jgi:putative ABC transport system permease protein
MFTTLAWLGRHLRALVRREKLEAELDEEIRFHLDKEIERNRALGLTPTEARRAALLAFGGIDRAKEEVRDARGARLLSEMWQDIRYACRMLRRAPGFAVVAIGTMGLGIGACAAVFSVVQNVLLRPLPLDDPDRVVVIRESFLPTLPDSSVASGKYLSWQREATSFESLGSLGATSFNLTGTGAPVHLHAAHITASVLPTLGLRPLLGRNFRVEELSRERTTVAILSFSLWQSLYGGREDILDQNIELNGRRHAVVGVLPPDSGLPGWAQVFAPGTFGPVDERNYASWHGCYVIGRLKGGVTPAQAESELRQLDERTARQFPESRGWHAHVRPVMDSLVGKVRPVLLTLLGAVGLFLLMACANVANLLLARAASRSREMAVRTAVGSSRARIVRQLLVEGAILSIFGATVGVLVSRISLVTLLALAPQNLPRATEVAVNGHALGLAAALAMLTGVAFGLVPAIHLSRLRLHETIKASAGRAGGGPLRQRLRSALVIAEVAIALVLLSGAGLLMRSFAGLQSVNPGFDPAGGHVAEIFLPRPRYTTPGQYVRFAEQTVADIAAAPGVHAAAVSANLPFSEHHMTLSMTVRLDVVGRPSLDGERPVANYFAVSPDYFRAMGIPVRRGRPFDHRDRGGGQSRPVAIVGDSLARRLFPDQDPVGQSLRLDGSDSWEIVGVAGDVKTTSLDADASFQIYVPFAQAPDNDIIYVVRTSDSVPAGQVSETIRAAVARADATVPIYSPRPLATMVGNSITRQRFALTLLGVFSALALLLAAIGVYGVMAYTVAQRTGEIGIRMALGARSRQVVGLVLRRGLLLIAAGAAVGLGGALLLTRFLQSLLFQVSSHDPTTLIAGVMVLTAAAALACVIPAHRATRVNPMVSLRSE